MKTTITISLRYALRAYDIITDSRYLEEMLENEFPEVWTFESEDKEDHEEVKESINYMMEKGAIPKDEYEIKTKN